MSPLANVLEVSYTVTLSLTLLILQKLEKCVWFAYSTTNAEVVITGCLENVLVVSASIVGAIVVGADTNSDSLTVNIAAVDVTVVALVFVSTQRNCSDGLVGYTVVGVVYVAEFAPFITTQFAPEFVDFCH